MTDLITNIFYVRGVSFRQEAIHKAYELYKENKLEGTAGAPTALTPDTDNPHHDTKQFPGTHAWKVWVFGEHIGFVPAELCGWITEHSHEIQEVATTFKQLESDMVQGLIVATVTLKAPEAMPHQHATVAG